MQLIELDEIKNFLKVDYDDDNLIIESLIIASSEYLKNATGKEFIDNELAILYRKILINEWYNNRELMLRKTVSEKVSFTLQSILLQLQYCD